MKLIGGIGNTVVHKCSFMVQKACPFYNRDNILKISRIGTKCVTPGSTEVLGLDAGDRGQHIGQRVGVESPDLGGSDDRDVFGGLG